MSVMDVEHGVSGDKASVSLSGDSFQRKTLMQLVEMSPQILRMMQVTANYWPEIGTIDLTWLVLHRTYFLLVRTILFISVGYSLYLFGVEVENGKVVGSTIAFTYFLDVVSVLPSQYANQKRLHNVADSQLNCAAFSVPTGVSQRFGIACLFTIGISICFGTMAYTVPLAVFALTTSEACVVAYLVFNMWFLLMDLQVSATAIDELLALAQKQELTLVCFNAVREDIHRRVRKSKWVSDFILLPCVASVISIVVLMFHIQPRFDRVAYSIGWLAALIKEMMFICVAFCYVATVNQKADDLTEKLSCEVWGLGGKGGSANVTADHRVTSDADVVVNALNSIAQQCERTSTATGEGSATSPEYLNDQASSPLLQLPGNIERLTMCVSSLTRPISFTLLFKRVNWQNVVVSFAGVAVSIFIGLARSLVVT